MLQEKKSEAVNVVLTAETAEEIKLQDEETLAPFAEEKHYLNYAKIRDFLSAEILDQDVKGVSDEIVTILALCHVKSNKELIRLLMDEDVFDDNQLTEIEEYMKKLILSMFYV